MSGRAGRRDAWAGARPARLVPGVAAGLLGSLAASLASAQEASPAAQATAAAAQAPHARASAARAGSRDGAHDFDFEIGTWKTHLKRLAHPLSGAHDWLEYDGTTVVRKVWDGRANLVELEVDGAAGHIEALSLRLYNPQGHQWSLNFASSSGGVLGEPTVGGFSDGRGEFYDQESFNGRRILVRFIITRPTRGSCHFEQAFSSDGGKSWEINWIATDTRATR